MAKPHFENFCFGAYHPCWCLFLQKHVEILQWEEALLIAVSQTLHIRVRLWASLFLGTNCHLQLETGESKFLAPPPSMTDPTKNVVVSGTRNPPVQKYEVQYCRSYKHIYIQLQESTQQVNILDPEMIGLLLRGSNGHCGRLTLLITLRRRTQMDLVGVFSRCLNLELTTHKLEGKIQGC